MLARTLGLMAALALPACAQAKTYETSAGPVDVVPVIQDLDNPWAVAFLPDGGYLITERDGKLLRFGSDGSRREVSGVPEVRASGQGGLLDVVLDPDFAQNKTIYLSYSEPEGFRSAHTAVARATLLGNDLEKVSVIFRQKPTQTGGRHFGSRIVPDGKGGIYVTLGDRGEASYAQSTRNTIGKVVHLDLTRAADGVPSYAGTPDAAVPTEMWSIGHRNAQGAALDETGQLWTVSHGARGGDEINRPEKGKNYGWPEISYGTTYGGTRIGRGTALEGMEQPVFYWDPSIAPSGMTIYSGKLWPEWAGDIFVGSLKFDYVSRLDRNGTEIAGEERLFPDAFIRIRDVREGPDGALWFLAVGDGALYRMTPAD
ncbi:MAG: PQQ-dependent sugar dehydrogenase [Pseudomonadota bacterium]